MTVFWIGFNLLILLLLALDLGVFNKKQHKIKTREALLWTAFWIFLSLLFNVFIYYAYELNWLEIGLHDNAAINGYDAALKYFTGYIIEKSLSLDNIFVIAIIFGYFKVPSEYQHRILFWGILGALVLRGVMILGGSSLLNKFDWMIYVFGGLLLLTALRMLIKKEEEFEPEKNILVKITKKFFRIKLDYNGPRFFIKENHKLFITPMFLVLVVIESTDVLFAIDSIPAIFAVTTDSFIVYTSNVFAILGLRSLYFALAAMMEKFKYIKISLVFILAFVGIKMIISHTHPIPTIYSLIVILVILSVGIITSIYSSRRTAN
ncbi:MAG: TerC/Alx family metal homeostasis membrane protein [Ignavibacteriales bacterium]|nr:TerC/Alx family metal homeostasis membrane protein [Ignavibacteriales bacterium]MCB9219520.1 TerC/Alx family metal homeostasis membrane protein [Ignavibacteriales bacterium]MCB9257877.1 TerC/Alx family metal homeostasis membrane protein [Ignavibacteriales bacterium]